ncbi:potassium channel family protein [Brevibacterium sp. 50QC2O2]|uniref:potassium channel family protein n=1 Tax=Brevibacterium TaxID=1696 RepID=UPI00211CC26F|nr:MULTISPECIES: potassium channel family protein [unclassified Brevibacterium]MCQ9369004.1 potassium channel family protein [Brevibacterium sp. 91QC2O2]MCQ9384194.1 potassium channel family protein [Brevibacterium sp. 68QC2CO]MCQ9388327.1 potassium channel family protein [Brevibacterium sp. 50QC2O2]
MYGSRLARWQRFTEWPLMAAALVFLIAYALQVIDKAHPQITAGAELAIRVTWLLFALDYLVCLCLAEHRLRWFARHLLDLLIVALPMFRPLRLMRFLTVLSLIQRGAGNMLRGRVLAYTVGASLLTILIAALAVLDAENGHGTIDTFGQALWWAFETMTTVGYGEFIPVTTAGRIIAAGLMVGGIALIGTVTATLSSWIVERVSAETNRATTAAEHATGAQVEALRAEIADLRTLLESQDAGKRSSDSPPHVPGPQ